MENKPASSLVIDKARNGIASIFIFIYCIFRVNYEAGIALESKQYELNIKSIDIIAKQLLKNT